MRAFGFGLVISAIIGVFAAEIVFDSDTESVVEPARELIITAHFPEENPFHHVVNGEKNSLFLLVDNKSELNATLKSISGSFHHPESQALIKNISTVKIPVPSLAGSKFSVPITFHSELKPGDYSLHLWVDYTTGESVNSLAVYEGIVTIVEPESSLLDFKMLTTYLLTAAIVGAGGYFAFLSFFPSIARPRRKRATRPSGAETSAPAGTAQASGVGYQEEWIPEHHLKKKRGPRKANTDTVLSSGDEKGAATSGTESGKDGSRRPRKGRKA